MELLVQGRGCAAPGAAFEAAVYVLVPGLRPRFRPQRRRGRRTMLKDARSEADRVLLAAKELASINVCAPHLRLPAPLLRGQRRGMGMKTAGQRRRTVM